MSRTKKQASNYDPTTTGLEPKESLLTGEAPLALVQGEQQQELSVQCTAVQGSSHNHEIFKANSPVSEIMAALSKRVKGGAIPSPLSTSLYLSTLHWSSLFLNVAVFSLQVHVGAPNGIHDGIPHKGRGNLPLKCQLLEIKV